jgi:thiamine biosynthesis lipoprotein
MKRLLYLGTTLILTAGCLLSACGGTGSDDNITTRKAGYYIFGTSADLVITTDYTNEANQTNVNNLNSKVKTFLAEVENSISSSVTTSYIYAYNQAELGTIVEVNKTTYDVMTIAKSVYENTDGYYNPAVYYCVDLYGFAPRATDSGAEVYDRTSNSDGSIPLPDQAYVQAFKQLSHSFKDVSVFEEEGKYYITKPFDAYVTVEGVTYSMKVDLGGIGKGYCADKIGEMLDEYNFNYGYFSFGSSSMAIKKSYTGENGNWKLAVTDPRGNADSYARIYVSDATLSTSGDHEQYYMIDGTRYCHIIDPTTGSPIQTGICSVTVIGGTAAEDDALTTAISAMGVNKAVEFINQKLSDKTVILLYKDGDEYKIISNKPDDFTILYDGYKLANKVENGKIVLN